MIFDLSLAYLSILPATFGPSMLSIIFELIHWGFWLREQHGWLTIGHFPLYPHSQHWSLESVLCFPTSSRPAICVKTMQTPSSETSMATVTVEKYWRNVFVYIRCSLMLSTLNSASYGIHSWHSSIHSCNAYQAQAMCPSSCRDLAWHSTNVVS